MADTRLETRQKILEFLAEKPASISEVKEFAKIDWRTAKTYLEEFESFGLVVEREEGKKKVYYRKDTDNYFQLPVKKEQKDIIKSIFALITKFSDQKPTKTQANKIIFRINKDLKLNLPIAWYKYGPISAIPYQGDETTAYTFDADQNNLIRETTEEYIKIDNQELQKKIYNEESNELYVAKEKLLETSFTTDKELLNDITIDLIKFSPKEAIEITTDFFKAIQLMGWNEKTRTAFTALWEYITSIIFKRELQEIYNYDLTLYFENKINSKKEEAQKIIKDIVDNFVESKYSQDPLYQRWKKRRKVPNLE